MPATKAAPHSTARSGVASANLLARCAPGNEFAISAGCERRGVGLNVAARIDGATP